MPILGRNAKNIVIEFTYNIAVLKKLQTIGCFHLTALTCVSFHILLNPEASMNGNKYNLITNSRLSQRGMV